MFIELTQKLNMPMTKPGDKPTRVLINVYHITDVREQDSYSRETNTVTASTQAKCAIYVFNSTMMLVEETYDQVKGMIENARRNA